MPSELWDVLTAMRRDQNPMLGENLTDLLEAVDEELPGFSDELLCFEWLRLARMGTLA